MLEIFIVLLMLALNGLLAAYELALTSINIDKLRVQESKHRKGSAEAIFMKTNIEKSLSTIQLGITFCGIIAGVVGGGGANESILPYLIDELGLNVALASTLVFLLTVVPIGGFTIIFGELIPKVFALRHNLSIVIRFSPWVKRFYRLVQPLSTMFELIVDQTIRLIDKLTGHAGANGNNDERLSVKDLRIFASLSRRAKLISPQEEKIIVGATKLSSRPIQDIMIPKHDMIVFDKNSSINNNLVIAQAESHTRYPVLEHADDHNSVLGYVVLKEVFFLAKTSPHAGSLLPILRPLTRIKANTSIADVLEKMVEEYLHLVLLENSRKHVVGYVTLEDVIEELVGDIQNEFDKLPHFIHKRGLYWLAGAGITVKHMLKATKYMPLSKFESDRHLKSTLDEYAQYRLGRIPHKGDVITIGNIEMLIRKVRRQKAQEFLIKSTKKKHQEQAP